MNKKIENSQFDSFSGSEVKKENSIDTNKTQKNIKLKGMITMNKNEYNKFEEELEMLRNEYVTSVAYKVVKEELANPSEELIESLYNPSEELIELLTNKAIKEASNNGIFEIDASRKNLIRDMVEGAIDNLF